MSNLITTGCYRKETQVTKFEYFSDETEYNKDDENYHFGALKKVLFPTCGRVEYSYGKHVFLSGLVKKEIKTEDMNKSHAAVKCALEDEDGYSEGYIIYTGKSYKEKNSTTNDLKLNIHYWTELGWKYDPIVIKRSGGAAYSYKVYGGENSFLISIDDVLEYAYFWNRDTKGWEQGTVSENKDLDDLDLIWYKEKLVTIIDKDDDDDDGKIDEVAYIDYANKSVSYFNTTGSTGYKFLGFDKGKWAIGYKIKERETSEIYKIVVKGEQFPERWVDYDSDISTKKLSAITSDIGQCAILWEYGSDLRLYIIELDNFHLEDSEYNRLSLDKKIRWGYMYKTEDEAEVFLSKDNYCVINNKDWDRIQWFYYTGGEWVRKKGKTTNWNEHGLEIGGDFDRGDENHHVHPGNNFFAVDYMKEISGRCRNERDRNVIRIIDKSHEKGPYHYHGKYSRRMNLGTYTEKYFRTGYNMLVGFKKTLNKYRYPAKKLAPQVVLKESGDWVEKGAAFSVSGKGRLKNHDVLVNGNSLLGKERRFGFEIDYRGNSGRRCGAAGYDWKGHLFDRFHLAKNLHGSFNQPGHHFVVKERKVYNGVDVMPRKTEYRYLQSGSYYFWINHCPMFQSVTATEMVNKKPARRMAMRFITGTGELKGKVLLNELFVNKALDKDVPEWKLIKSSRSNYSVIKESGWPEGVFKANRTEEEALDNGLVATKKYDYTKGVQIEYSNLESKKSTEHLLVIENDNLPAEVRDAFLEANRLSDISVSSTKDIGGTEEKVIKSAVTTWQDLYPNSTTLDIYAPFMQFNWKEEYGGTYEEFDFDNPLNQENWIRTATFSKYNPQGMVLEAWDGSSYNGGNGVPSSNFYGQNGTVKIAEINNAEYDECSFFTCDFDDHIDDGQTVEYYCKEKDWRKGGSSLIVPGKKHFGDSVVSVSGSNTGPNTDILKPKLSDFIIKNQALSAEILYFIRKKNNTTNKNISNRKGKKKC